jgi:non-heme chloroperoxidase
MACRQCPAILRTGDVTGDGAVGYRYVPPSLAKSAVIDWHLASIETDFRAELSAITVPTLIIHGDADVSEPIEQRGRRTAQLIPRSQFKLYEGAPHGLMLTHTDRLNADLLEFIRE